MSRYINKEDIIALLTAYSDGLSYDKKFQDGFKAAIPIIQDYPASDQLPRTRAMWNTYWVGGEKEFCQCANCGNEIPPTEKSFQQYCYKCGSKMSVLGDILD